MVLVSTPKNPIPLGASSGYLDIRKGVRVRYASWQSALRERRGTVCIFPGRNEFIEKYFEVVGELRRRGFAVAVLDWRGQGGSSRLTRSQMKGHVRDFDDYEEDLAHFMKGVVLPDCPAPYYALAHSMAATVLFRAATKRGCWFSRIVMTAPMVKLMGLPMPQGVCAPVADGLTLLGFGKQAVPGSNEKYWASEEFEGNPLTSDRERFFRNISVLRAAPGLAVGPPTVGWLNAAFEAMAQLGSEKFAPRIRIPALMVAAGDDQVVSSKAIEDLASRLRAGSQLVLRGSRHEILQERDAIREQFWAAFDAYIPGVALSKAG
ncbi:MAG: alpha/beta fold hydrolase [Methyloceanibacter sp.]|uniref:alpha/beta fold hydrolase n=1 Tax=Methyloceanibacter sp. TaxID=1965321 RepID=UPI003D6D758D